MSGSEPLTKPIVASPIVVTEQASSRIIVLDPHRDWSSPAAELWSWHPGPDSDIADATLSWGLPDDARLRTDPSTGTEYVLVCDSFGLLASIPYPDGGAVEWSVAVGRDDNPHGIERLPDGKIVAAASTGGWVRVYAAGLGRHSDVYVEDVLVGAHEVFWDRERGVLWAVGDHHLVRYSVGGTTALPTLERRATYDLPTIGGHDLQPDQRHAGMLWVTTVEAVHRFDVARGEFLPAALDDAPELYRANVKSVGTDVRSGSVLQTTPKAGNASTWCTDQVDVFCDDGQRISKVLEGAQIYRARWFEAASN